jgi:hypothetical protein
METTSDISNPPPKRDFTPVGVLPMPADTALAWFLLQLPPRSAAHPVRAFLTTDAAEAR